MVLGVFPWVDEYQSGVFYCIKVHFKHKALYHHMEGIKDQLIADLHSSTFVVEQYDKSKPLTTWEYIVEELNKRGWIVEKYGENEETESTFPVCVVEKIVHAQEDFQVWVLESFEDESWNMIELLLEHESELYFCIKNT